uniref:Hemopexin n=1 Tax=Aquila chrysaetos chrysaetos TaxID=223781 RepID=A0A663EUA3_AQUCH
MLFFRGEEVWESSHGGFRLHARPLAASWPEVGGPIDAALRLYGWQHPQEHQSLYLFQGEQVWAYFGGQLQPGFPRRIGDEFPGVPGGLDAAVECHPEECGGKTILFFKGDTVYAFDLALRVTKPRSWPGLGPCDAALRWLERYYCLRGTHFQRFNPLTGEVPPSYPRDLRDYFIPCPGRGHWNASWGAAGDRCSEMPFQALLSDDTGRIYAFRGGLSFRLDSLRDGHHAWPLGQTWPGLEGEVDAAFAWDGRTYLIQVWPRGAALSPFPSPVGPAPIPSSLPHWQDPPLPGLCLRWGSSGTSILAPRLAGGRHPRDQGISRKSPPPRPRAAWGRGGTAYGSGPQDRAALAPSPPWDAPPGPPPPPTAPRHPLKPVLKPAPACRQPRGPACLCPSPAILYLPDPSPVPVPVPAHPWPTPSALSRAPRSPSSSRGRATGGCWVTRGPCRTSWGSPAPTLPSPAPTLPTSTSSQGTTFGW